MLIEEMDIYRLLKRLTSLFWLIFLVPSPPSLTTLILPHYSLMNTGLGKSFKFATSSTSSSPSSIIATLTEDLPFL